MKQIAFLLLSLTLLGWVGCSNKKHENESKSANGYDIVRGRLMIGHGIKRFIPCADTLTYWISDTTNMLEDAFLASIGGDVAPFSDVYVELEVERQPAKMDNPNIYSDEMLVVKRVISIATIEKHPDCL